MSKIQRISTIVMLKTQKWFRFSTSSFFCSNQTFRHQAIENKHDRPCWRRRFTEAFLCVLANENNMEIFVYFSITCSPKIGLDVLIGVENQEPKIGLFLLHTFRKSTPVFGAMCLQHHNYYNGNFLQSSGSTNRAFCAAGLRVWNYLPTDLTQATLSYSRLRQSLNMFLFDQWDQSAV